MHYLYLRLENWQFEEWGSQVTVVSSDMREWVAPEKADIIVSELLGSFADNELSPECLDGAQHFLKGASRLGCTELGGMDYQLGRLWQVVDGECVGGVV